MIKHIKMSDQVDNIHIDARYGSNDNKMPDFCCNYDLIEQPKAPMYMGN